MAPGPQGPWILNPQDAREQDPTGDSWEREWGPLIAGWLRLRCGTLEEFWNARPCEVAAALGIGVYAPKEAAPTGPPRPTHGGKYPHARDPLELNRQRVLAAKGQAPAPEPIRDPGAVQRLTGAL